MNKLIELTTDFSNKVMQWHATYKNTAPETEVVKKPAQLFVAYSVYANQQEDEDNESTMYTPQLA